MQSITYQQLSLDSRIDRQLNIIHSQSTIQYSVLGFQHLVCIPPLRCDVHLSTDSIIQRRLVILEIFKLALIYGLADRNR